MASIPHSRRIKAPAAPVPKLAGRRLDKGVARYYRLYELLSTALQDGTIAPQSALPSEPELCARYGISRTTVRHALARLEREGRILRRRGSGTYARPQRPAPRLSLQLHALRESVAALESGSRATTLRSQPAPVPPALTAIAAEIGPAAYLLERLRRSHGQPMSLTAAYLPEQLGRRLPRPIPRAASVISLLHRLGAPIAAIACSVGAVTADAAAARALRVPLGSPLLRVRAVLTDPAGAQSAVLESLCRSEHLRLRLTERGASG